MYSNISQERFPTGMLKLIPPADSGADLGHGEAVVFGYWWFWFFTTVSNYDPNQSRTTMHSRHLTICVVHAISASTGMKLTGEYYHIQNIKFFIFCKFICITKTNNSIFTPPVPGISI